MAIFPTQNPNDPVGQFSPAVSPGGTFGAFKPQPAGKSKARLYVLIGLAVLLLAAAVYYLFFLGGVSGVSLKTTPAIPPAQELTPLELRVSRLPGFNFEVLQGALYQGLKLYGEIPIKVDTLGRPNPFLPY